MIIEYAKYLFLIFYDQRRLLVAVEDLISCKVLFELLLIRYKLIFDLQNKSLLMCGRLCHKEPCWGNLYPSDRPYLTLKNILIKYLN